jgi:hypothetical protein
VPRRYAFGASANGKTSFIDRNLTMRPGQPVAREFECVRHGVVHLFAGFNVRTGNVLGRVYEQETRSEFIDFLERCAWRYRQGPVHCVIDNASYHSTPEVKAWLAEHPRFVFHFTPTHASWLAYGEELIHDPSIAA